jgi:polyhydroxyalkanoate synthesis regulator phasin
MAEPDSSARERVERLGLAAIGAVALTADRIEELSAELAERGAMTREDARQLLGDVTARWRADTTRLTERAGDGLQGFLVGLGLVTRDDFDELELRLAQIEHRLRLVEDDDGGAAAAGERSVQH